MPHLFEKIIIISGGQTGVDQAALYFAVQKKIQYSGWCPYGRNSESGNIPTEFLLQQCNTNLYMHRTFLNVRDSDGTLMFQLYNGLDKGSLQTIQFCYHFNKPFLIIHLTETTEDDILSQWIALHKICRLNMAGPRESFTPGIFNQTLQFLNTLI